MQLARAERRDLFAGAIPVLSIEMQRPGDLPGLFWRFSTAFPNLTFYDADLPISLRYAAVFGVFALCRCRVEVQGNQIKTIAALDSPWDLDPEYPPLRVLGLEPDCNPAHAEPKGVIFSYTGYRYRLPLEPVRGLLANLNAVLRMVDPDLILTSLGRHLAPAQTARTLERQYPAAQPRPSRRDHTQSAAHLLCLRAGHLPRRTDPSGRPLAYRHVQCRHVP